MSTSAAAQEAAPGGPSYTYTMIDIPNATCVGAYGINDKGQVVLYDCSADPIIPYLWQGGVLTRLPQHPLAGPVGTTPWGISNAGEIVGYYGDANGIYHGFTYQLSTGAWMTVDHPTPANLADNPPALVWTFLRGIAPNAGESLGLPASYQIPRYTSGSVYNPQRSVMDSNPADTWQDFDGASDPVYGPLNSIVGAS